MDSSSKQINVRPRSREIITGDLNAHHEMWDRSVSDERGNNLAECVIENNSTIKQRDANTKRPRYRKRHDTGTDDMRQYSS